METYPHLGGTSPFLIVALREAKTYASSDEPILILGEPGTGKSTLAGQIHEWSGRGGRFIHFSVSGSAAELYLGDLFGHVKGAFTGAVGERQGVLSAASDGTILLDELSAASRQMQAALLALFDRDAVRRLGEDLPRPVTARIIGASNVDLRAEVRGGRFRADLLDRFGVIQITLPPLRERRSDILALFDTFLQTALRPSRSDRVTYDSSVRTLLLSHRWPGNVRELEHLAKATAAAMDDGLMVTIAALPKAFLESSQGVLLGRTESASDRAQAVLDRTGGNKSKAAREMGVSRTHFYKLLGRHDHQAPD